MLVNELAYGHSARSHMCCNEQLLPFKATGFSPWCHCSSLDATATPPYMEANTQQGITDTPQLHGSTTRAAPWGDVLTNPQQRFNDLRAALHVQLPAHEKRL